MNGDPVTREDVVRAAETIRGRVRRTPLLDGSAARARACGSRPSCCSTPARSRPGAWSTGSPRSAPRSAQRGVAGASAGNHAIALAWGAAAEGLECVVFSWPAASRVQARPRPSARRRDRHRGRRIPADAFARLEQHLAETGSVLVHPFDDPLVMAGQGTVGLEIARGRCPTSTSIVVPVGGGGLISGIAAAVAPRGVRVVGVEPEGSAALSAARSRPGARSPLTPRRSRAGSTRRTSASNGARGLPRDRRRGRDVTDERDRGGDASALCRREARLRAGRRGRCRGRARRRSRRRTPWSPSSREATSGPRSPLLSWLADEGRHPPRVRRRARDLLLRERVHDAVDQGRAPRRDLLRVPPVLHGQAEARWTPAAGSSASSAGSRRPPPPTARSRSGVADPLAGTVRA